MPVIMDGLDDGNARLFRDPYDPRRNQWKGIVQVHDIGPEAP
jgi:hypothetical protein